MLRGPFNGRLHLHNAPEQIFSNKTGSKVNLPQTIMKKHLSLQKMLQKICSYHLRFSLWYLNNFIKYANVSESLQSLPVGFFCFYFSLLTAGYLCFRHWVWPFHVHHPVRLSQRSYSMRVSALQKGRQSLTFSPLELDGNQGCIPPGRASFSFFL